MAEKNFNRLMFVVTVIFIFALMFELNNLMPLHRDDYDYSMVWKTGEHINSVSDVFDSTLRHYFSHGGRFFTVFCLNLFLWLGKFPFDFANAAMFTVLVLLIYFHARREFKISGDAGIFAAAGLMAWLSFPHFGEVAIWKSGSTVYLWSAVPVAIFLLPYNFFLAKNFPDKKFLLHAMFLLGLIAGCSVENLGVTATLLTAAISYHCYKKNNLQSWMAAGSIGSLIGVIILIAAPGNFVRYDDQSVGKGILAHIGNQFAAGGEMLLYILPVILVLLCAYRILKISVGKRRGKIFSPQKFIFPKACGVLLVIAGIFSISYFNGSFITKNLHDFLVKTFFANASEKFLERFDNFMMKSEEMIIYWLIILAIYFLLRNALGFFGANWKNFSRQISLRDVLNFFPQIEFSLFLFALGLFNNFVMIAAPTFPARATFSSVAMFLIGAVVILRLEVVREKLFTKTAGKIVKLGAVAIGIFTYLAAFAITSDLRAENDLRIAEIKKSAAEGRDTLTFAPIEIQNRALRHVFFVDFDNGVTVDGLCEYYKIKKISVTK